MTEPVDYDRLHDAIDKALSDVAGVHGAWILAVECMDQETGELIAANCWSKDGTRWAQAGLARMLTLDLESSFRRHYEGGDDDL